MGFLDIQYLCRSFGGLKAVNDVSFSLKPGQIKAVIGPNGAGKTTLFNLVSGSLKPDSGEVFFGDKPIHGMEPHQIASLGIARTFQNIKLFPQMTVLENVMVGRHIRSRSGFLSAMFRMPWTVREERSLCEHAMEFLEFFGLQDMAGIEAGSIAFGKQRTVEFARALAMDPTLLLLDEPAAGLNIHETTELAAQIASIRDRGITVLLIEHDMSLVMDISDEITVLSSGKKIAEGIPADIQKNTEVIKVYLGEDYAQGA